MWGKAPEPALLQASQLESQQAGPSYSKAILEHSLLWRGSLDKLQRRPNARVGTQRHNCEGTKFDFSGRYFPSSDFAPPLSPPRIRAHWPLASISK